MFVTGPEYTSFIDATPPRLLTLPVLLPQMNMYCSPGLTVYSKFRNMYRGNSLIRNQNLRIKIRSGPLLFLIYFQRVDKSFV